MYKVTITTKYNDIKLLVEDIDNQDIQEILAQPWVLSYSIEETMEVEPEGYKRLVR